MIKTLRNIYLNTTKTCGWCAIHKNKKKTENKCTRNYRIIYKRINTIIIILEGNKIRKQSRR